MSVGLDTSVALRLLTGTPPEQAEVARAFVAAASAPVTISDLVIGETYFALRHHYNVPHADSVRAMRLLLADARIRGSGVALAVLTEASGTSTRVGVGLIDRLIQADYGRDALEVVTFDRDFAKLAGVQLLTTQS